ncbi:MAG: glycosyltransferase family 4 protein [Acidisphaera sp.]|nr:glycosyltransferase family 4 protein [Acidisphaera sp.]
MRLLIWQWGRRGAGPRYAAELAAGFRALPDMHAVLSLSAQAEILQGGARPVCDLPFPTYDSLAGAARRAMAGPFLAAQLAQRLRKLRLDAAICAMPAPLDLVMSGALHRSGVPYAVVVHDADRHPGESWPLQFTLQRRLVRQADAVIALTGHVATRLRHQGLGLCQPLIMATHPPFAFGPVPPPPLSHGGPLRLLCFGRLLPYKGLDLLADALGLVGARPDLQVRVAGSGPESATLQRLRRLPGVSVENRWVPEDEVGPLLAWADALVLSHREASQSGVAAAAIAARRWLVATRVGGISEQLRDEPLARLCDPTAASLATALTQLIETPPPIGEAPDPLQAWRATAAGLGEALATAFLDRKARPGALPPTF